MKGLMKPKFLLILMIVGLLLSWSFGGPAPDKKMVKMTAPVKRAGIPFLSGKTQAQKEAIIAKMSGPLMFKLAKVHGITSILGKAVTQGPSTKSPANRHTIADNPVGADPNLIENEPSIAVHPKKPNVMVSICHNYVSGGTVNIGTYTSLDSGATWGSPVLLPKRFPTDTLSDPVVRFAPNGSCVYASYLSIRYDGSSDDVMVTKSTNYGKTWLAPKVAIPGSLDWDGDGTADMPDKPWLDVHPFPDSSAANGKVYITATVFGSSGANYIIFTRSTNFINSSFSSWRGFYYSDNRTVQGARAIGGRGGDVLLCFYSASDDGWGPGSGGGGYFDLEAIKFTNYGTTQSSWVDAIYHVNYELPYWLGPFASGETVGQYHRWWGGMFPSIAMTPAGEAYISFTTDPVSGQSELSSEDGDVYWAKASRPYTNWTLPIDLSTYNFKAQGYPTIYAKKVTGGAAVTVAWEDHTWSIVDNELYDIVARDNTGLTGGYPTRITDFSSYSDSLFIGDYIDSSGSANVLDKVVHVVWTDRSDEVTATDHDSDVYEDIIQLIIL